MVDVLSLDKTKVGEVDLPSAFDMKINEDLIKRAFISEMSGKFQIKYTDPLAGKRKAAELTKRRRSYKTVYGRGLSRTPRKTMQHVGSSFSYMGAVAPNAVGGREAHPPKAEKKTVKKMNKKELYMAINMGIAASAKKEFVSKYHRLPENANLPIVIDDSVNNIYRTKDAEKLLKSFSLWEEKERGMEKRIRAGKGKMRGRKYKRRLGMLLVTTDDSKVGKAFSNLNISVKKPERLSISDVSHAGKPGRMILWTKSAISKINR